MIASDTDSFHSDDDNDKSFDNHDEQELQEEDEEELLKSKLEKVEFGKLIQANKRIEASQKVDQLKSINKKTKYLKQKFEVINKSRAKESPREMSALVKPNKLKQFINKEHSRNTQPQTRDPRFDDSGIAGVKIKNSQKNYGFIEEKARDYVKSLDSLKSKMKLDHSELEAIKDHKSTVKGFLSQAKHKKMIDNAKSKLNIKGKVDAEKKKEIKEIVDADKADMRNAVEESKFLKRKTKKQNSAFNRKSKLIN